MAHHLNKGVSLLNPQEQTQLPSESIVDKRLVRNIRYRLTYCQVLESFLEPEPEPVISGLFRSMLACQQKAAGMLAAHLHQPEDTLNDWHLNRKLLAHAAERDDVESRLWFLRNGWQRAVSWYSMQLVDQQMAEDEDVSLLLFELGEMEAATLWYLESVMMMLGIIEETDSHSQEDRSKRKSESRRDRKPASRRDAKRPDWDGQASRSGYRGSRKWSRDRNRGGI